MRHRLAPGQLNLWFLVLYMQIGKGKSRDDIREAQAGELRETIDDQNIPSKQPVIIIGDFNIDSYSQVGY